MTVLTALTSALQAFICFAKTLLLRLFLTTLPGAEHGRFNRLGIQHSTPCFTPSQHLNSSDLISWGVPIMKIKESSQHSFSIQGTAK